MQVGEGSDVLSRKWRQKQDRANSRPCRTGGSKPSRNVFPSLTSMVAISSGTDRGWACGHRGPSKQGREMAYMGIQNPLDQCCAITHSAKMEKWCHMWLLRT